jgi:hypothetical protein
MSTHPGAAQHQVTVNAGKLLALWFNHTSSLKSNQPTNVDALVNVCCLFESAFYMGEEKS